MMACHHSSVSSGGRARISWESIPELAAGLIWCSAVGQCALSVRAKQIDACAPLLRI